MSEHQPSPGDFNREGHDATSDVLVPFLTEYGIHATPEETDAMIDRAYGKGRTPGYEGRRWDREPRMCEQCGQPIKGRGRRFCSHKCWGEWQRPDRPEHPPTSIEFLEEAEAALRALRIEIAERDEE